MALDNIGLRERLSIPRCKQKSRLSVSKELLQESCNARVKVYLAIGSMSLDAVFNLAIPRLLVDEDRPKIGGDVLGNINAKCLPNPQTCCPKKRTDRRS